MNFRSSHDIRPYFIFLKDNDDSRCVQIPLGFSSLYPQISDCFDIITKQMISMFFSPPCYFFLKFSFAFTVKGLGTPAFSMVPV